MTERDDAARAEGWRHRLLVALPVLVLGALAAGSLATAVQLGPPPTREPVTARPRPAVPLLSVRRDLDPLAEEAAEHRLRTGLGEVLAGLPADTCLTVEAGDVRFSHRADDPQAPASSTKILTAVAALVALGGDHRYTTTVATATPPAAGVVAGDLHLVGGGDPLLAQGEYAARYRRPQTFSDLRALAGAVAAAGVVRVEGAVVGDESRYDTVRYHPAWPSRFITQDQTGPLSALAVNDGFAEWPSQGAGPVEPAPDPAAHAADVFRLLLEERGITVAAGSRSGPAPVGASVVAEHRSPPLREVVAQMLAESDNATAELVLKELGLQVEGAGTFAAGAAAVAEVLAGAGFDMAGVALVDGSGLAPGNTLDCGLLMDLLEHPPTADAVREGLAVAGETGTLAERGVGTDLAGRVRAKTGTLNQVTALVGQADTGAGEATFALVVNVVEPERIQLDALASQQRLAELLVAFPDRPDLSAFEP
ncbi:MAG TPA: D-alanyl-D-alanine carboxypeptidase/D-alanyl-D-alanine-endopeptidase [Acidimicrobiales bacterium]